MGVLDGAAVSDVIIQTIVHTREVPGTVSAVGGFGSCRLIASRMPNTLSTPRSSSSRSTHLSRAALRLESRRLELMALGTLHLTPARDPL